MASENKNSDFLISFAFLYVCSFLCVSGLSAFIFSLGHINIPFTLWVWIPLLVSIPLAWLGGMVSSQASELNQLRDERKRELKRLSEELENEKRQKKLEEMQRKEAQAEKRKLEALQALRLRLLTEWQEKALAVPSAKNRSAFRIDGRGNQGFVEVVNKVLDDLKEHVPHRYVEALTYFPQAVYDTSLLKKTHPRGGKVVAYSKGYFALDGRDDYLGFRWTFLHEVGHTVAVAQRKTKSDVEENEQVADNYACQVLEEIALITPERYNIESSEKKLPPFKQWRRNELIAAGCRAPSVDTYLQLPHAPFS